MKRQEMIEVCTLVKAAPHTNSRESRGEDVRPTARRGIFCKTGCVTTLFFQCNPISRGILIVRNWGDCKMAFQDGCRWLRKRHQILTVIDHRSATVVGELFGGLGMATGEIIICILDRIRCPKQSRRPSIQTHLPSHATTSI